MPNHVTNVLTASQAVIDALLNDEGHVDFSLVVPQPDNIEKGNCVGGRSHPEGVVCWYGWNSLNWGTKWNAYETDLSEREQGRVKFQTAWAAPLPVFEALAAKFPGEEFKVLYADEDLGHNCGYVTAGEGTITVTELPGGHPLSEAFAVNLVYGMSYADWQAENEVDGERYEQESATSAREALDSLGLPLD